MKSVTWRSWIVGFTIFFSIYLLIPTYLKFSKGQTVPKIAKADDPWYYHWLPSESLKLGLDLMGGLHLVLGIDFEEVHRDAVSKLKNQLQEILAQDKIEGVAVEVSNDNKLLVTSPDAGAQKMVDGVIGKHLSEFVDPDGMEGKAERLRLSSLYEAEVRRRAIDQSLETLRNRIDEFGIAEPILQRQGEEKILLQFPGVTDPGRLKDIIGRTAKLSFQIVRSGPEEPGGGNGAPSETELQKWVDEFGKTKNMKVDPNTPMPTYLKEINAFYASKLPKGTEILFHKVTNVNTKEVTYIPYLLDKDALVTGEDLQDAYYSFNQENNEPIVNFQLTPVGATKFEKATGENVHKYMAIVLDNNVHSAPRIKQRIGGGRAMIEMGTQGRAQDQILNEAKDTSLVLRSGALPARLLFLEERTIGPSLGADSIRQGTESLMIGMALMFGLLIIYYRGSGVIAAGALVANLMMIVAALAAFEGTLTLPGLAGLTLSLAMAVDANVLIFEHTRDELRKGKTFRMALNEGYDQAFGAIFDANVTMLIASLVLFSFGYGPIRGFAVTMLIGNVASLYTNVFMTKVVFDTVVFRKDRTSFSV